MKKLILASSSAYRRDLLARLGLPFTALAPQIDESPRPGELPAALAARLAAAKAMKLITANAIVVGSDQVASLDGAVLEKPGTYDLALAQLQACQGRIVLFHTAVCVWSDDGRPLQRHVDLTRARFASRSRQELERYLELEPAFDCAGGFKVEGLGVSLFNSIETHDPTALIGLPLIWLASALRAIGLNPLQTRA